MNKLYKPNGKAVEVNDSSLEFALNLGWTKKEPTTKPAPKTPTKKAV